MKKYGMVIDVAKCTGCNNCFLACKDENAGEAHEGYTAAQPIRYQNWIHVNEIERGHLPQGQAQLRSRHLQPLRQPPLHVPGKGRRSLQA